MSKETINDVTLAGAGYRKHPSDPLHEFAKCLWQKRVVEDNAGDIYLNLYEYDWSNHKQKELRDRGTEYQAEMQVNIDGRLVNLSISSKKTDTVKMLEKFVLKLILDTKAQAHG